jgi:pilus assembly protein Flp/PilA
MLNLKQKPEVLAMKNFLRKLLRDESGQGMTEYALILALVAIGAIVALGLLREEIIAVFNSIVTALQGAPRP